MRLIKTFGLAAIAAIAVSAFLGPSSAMASGSTALCTAHQETCSAGNLTTSVHTIASNPLMHTSIVDVICDSTLLEGSLLALGSPQAMHVTSIAFTNCRRHSGSACTIQAVLLGLAFILRTAKDLSTAYVTGGVVQVKCGIFINCSYGGEPAFTALGLTYGGNGTIHASMPLEEDATHSGGNCPSTATLLALGEPLAGIYISS